MELFQELLITLLVAIFISFLIANVVSSRRSGDQNGVGGFREEVIAEELNDAGRLEATGKRSEGRAELVGEAVAERVEEFVGEPAPVEDESRADERRELTEKGREAEKEVQTHREFVPEEMEDGVTKLSDDHQNLAEVTAEKTGEKEIVADEGKEGNSVEDEAVEIESAPRTERPEEIRMEEEEASGEVVEEKKVEIDIEDDWQGIERSDLEKEFAKAAKFVESGYGEDKLASVGSDVVMQLYGLHKLVTEGSCHEQPPMALKLSARAKWNAWQKLGNMDPEVAMKQYVNLLSDSVPQWADQQSIGEETIPMMPLEAVDASTASSHRTNFPYEERGSEPKYDSETSESTGVSTLENKVKE